MWIPSQGFRHAVDLLLAQGIRSSKPSLHLAEQLVALADDMKAPPEAAEWVKAEYERLLGPSAAAADILDRIGRRRGAVERRDLFLVYVPEDRLTVAGPLAVELSKRRVTVAFSEYEVANPDELLAAVTRGFSDNRAGALLFTTEFTRKPWSRQPLDPRLLILRDLTRPPEVAERLAVWLLEP
jgi:hypothetical protein